MKALITGVAGFVGSTLAETLLRQGASVFGVDNFTLGTRKHLRAMDPWGKTFTFDEMDVSKRDWHQSLRGKKFDVLFHLAANSDISLGHQNPELDFDRTCLTTLETLRAAKDLGIPRFVFSSTSAVYGNTPVLPTPEDLGELTPVSVYGAGKLASEAYVSAFAANYGLQAWVFRFGNVVGPKLTHGVIFDFVKRLTTNPQELRVLGNGRQCKTYIHVEDCISGILTAVERAPRPQTPGPLTFNLSTPGATTVQFIAEEVMNRMNLDKSKIIYGTESIGWVGDVPKTSLTTSRMETLGWSPKRSSDEAVKVAIATFIEWSRQVDLFNTDQRGPL